MNRSETEFGRRRLISLGIGTAVASAFLPTMAAPAAAVSVPRELLDIDTDAIERPFPFLETRSSNGWFMEAGSDAGGTIWTTAVQGIRSKMAVRVGDVETVFNHLVRRYHYEVDTLNEAEIVVFKDFKGALSEYESNHASGTAIDIRPGWFPLGSSDGFGEVQLGTLKNILEEFDGIVVWGGNFDVPDQGHFEIAVPPEDSRLQAIANAIREENSDLGRGAGTSQY